jgi:hypothetical protein
MMGLIACLLLGGTALAQDTSMQQDAQKKEQKAHKESHEGKGGSGKEQAQAEGQVKGTVVGAREDKLYIKDANGAVIPIEVNKSTKIAGRQLQKNESIKSELKREFQMGDEVRTSFNVEKDTRNVAISVDKSQK